MDKIVILNYYVKIILLKPMRISSHTPQTIEKSPIFEDIIYVVKIFLQTENLTIRWWPPVVSLPPPPPTVSPSPLSFFLLPCLASFFLSLAPPIYLRLWSLYPLSVAARWLGF
ncbi:hypothetical protein YC2023_065535 [Brassica napus]